MVQVQRELRGLVAVGVLVGLDADLQVPPADQGRHAHAIVVHQLQLAGLGDHHVGVLEVAMGDPHVDQLPHQQSTQRSAAAAQGPRLPSSDAGAGPVEKRLALDPVHEDQRVPLAVAGRADALVAVLELHQAGELVALEILADQVVALAALRRFGGEDPQREVAAAVAAVDPLVDHRERPGPGPRLVPLVLLDAALRNCGSRKATCGFCNIALKWEAKGQDMS